MASEYAIVRSKLLGLGMKLAPRIVLIREPERARALIDAEVTAALQDLTLDAERKLQGGDAAAP